MSTGLAISRVVQVTVSLAPIALTYRNFGAALIAGDSAVIDIDERIREYNNIDEVADDFGTAAPEYEAALLHFSQTPQSNLLYIGRWARTATSAILHGKILTAAEKALANFTAVTDGKMQITVDGVVKTLTGLDFSGALNLNGVANVVNTALGTSARCQYKSVIGRFDITSGTSGATSTITYATGGAGAGTDVSVLMGLNQTVDTPVPINGIAAETAVDGVLKLLDKSSAWYALEWACSTFPTDADYVDVSLLIEAQDIKRIHCITTMHTGNIDPLVAGSLSEQLQALELNSSMIMYSGTNPYAATSIWAKFATIDYAAQNSQITAKFKTLPGVVADILTASEATTAASRNCNVYPEYANGPAIFQEGKMCGGWFIDEKVGLDWLANQVQTNVFNLLYQTPTKVPQTDAGTHLLTTVVSQALDAAVNNGLVAPGQWNGPNYGQVKMGDFLPKGYYVYAPLMATQSQSDREQRKSVPIIVLAKMAGAVHFANVAIYANR